MKFKNKLYDIKCINKIKYRYRKIPTFMKNIHNYSL